MMGKRSPAHRGMVSQEMLLEARGKHEDAANLIQKHLEDAPDCQMLLKRQARRSGLGTSSPAHDIAARQMLMWSQPRLLVLLLTS